jgi:hypothetical protein
MPRSEPDDLGERAVKEWLAVRRDDRLKIRESLMRTIRSGGAPIQAVAPLCRLVNVLDMIEAERGANAP